MKQPCEKYCKERNGECHSNCKKWLEYEKERNKGYEIKGKEKEQERVLYEIERDRKKDIALGRMRRRRNKKYFKRY